MQAPRIVHATERYSRRVIPGQTEEGRQSLTNDQVPQKDATKPDRFQYTRQQQREGVSRCAAKKKGSCRIEKPERREYPITSRNQEEQVLHQLETTKNEVK
jgi:hypothetical protein